MADDMTTETETDNDRLLLAADLIENGRPFDELAVASLLRRAAAGKAERAPIDRETLGEKLALVDDHNGCHARVREWEALEQWEKDAHPDEEPFTDREEAEWWNRRADAAITHLVGDNGMSAERWKVSYTGADGVGQFADAADEAEAKALAHQLGGLESVIDSVPLAPFATKTEPVTIDREAPIAKLRDVGATEDWPLMFEAADALAAQPVAIDREALSDKLLVTARDNAQASAWLATKDDVAADIAGLRAVSALAAQPVTIERKALRSAIGSVLFNASNYPEKVASRIMGQDIGPLIEKVTRAVMERLAAQSASGEERATKAQWGVRYQTSTGSEVHTLSDKELCLRFVENPPQWLRRKATDPYPMTIMSRIAASEWVEVPNGE